MGKENLRKFIFVFIFLVGLIEKYIQDNMLMTKNRDMVYFIGQMEYNIRDRGIMVNNKEKVNILIIKDNLRQENGKKVNKYCCLR